MASCETCKHQNKPAYVEPCKGCKHNATDNYQPITRADRIRSMTDEELARMISLQARCDNCGFSNGCPIDKNACFEIHLKWLRSEVQNDD